LITIRGDELVKEPAKSDRELEGIFKVARHWGAVLLVADADAYVDQSNISSIQRREFVASFHRMLQYYRGVLFLATSHVERFDDKLLSRVDAPIHCRDLNNDERWSLWQALFANFKKEKGDEIQIDESAFEYVQTDGILLSLEWNAHEIRQGKIKPLFPVKQEMMNSHAFRFLEQPFKQRPSWQRREPRGTMTASW
jgi:hypothetical protein